MECSCQGGWACPECTDSLKAQVKRLKAQAKVLRDALVEVDNQYKAYLKRRSQSVRGSVMLKVEQALKEVK